MSASGSPPRQHVIDRLRDVVSAHSDSIAIATAGEPAFTYGNLWERAQAIADELHGSRGVVAIYMEKSPELVAAMIGTWLAGRAFVPILPDLPEERRITIVDETGADDAIVTSDRVPPDLRARCKIVDARFALAAATASACAPHDTALPGASSYVRRTYEPDGGMSDSGRSSSSATAAAATAAATANRAYIIYTSGSTGRPKGVVVSHRGLVNLLDAQITAFDLRVGDRCLWMLSPSFDASISDVFTALLAGATLCIEHPARLRSSSDLLGVLRQRAVTHVDLPPSLLPLLPADVPSSLRTVVIGGEVCAPAAVRAWASRVRLVNVYGPTEATVCSTLCVCDSTWSRPLIGRPLPNVELRIVDGELWIGGIGVADGYVASPDLEAAKFVAVEGARWFRTGDRVVEHAGGEIEFLGRVDRQLKLHGVLVAPEEIEARLREHPSIMDVVVVAEQRDGARGARDRLVAYCVPSSNGPTLAVLRAHLAASLDARLIPRRLVFVDALPHTPSGKVDVAALSRLSSRPVDSHGGSTACSTTTERALAEIWERILDVDSVGRRDSFLDLGGDSFAVVELLAMAELAGLSLSADDVYEAPVLADLAQRADEGGRAVARSCAHLIDDISPIVAALARSAAGVARPPWQATLLPGVYERPLPERPSVSARSYMREGDASREGARSYIRGTAASREGSPDCSILLTGATGFLGVHVLAELIGRASVTCLVRASDDITAGARVAAALERVIGGAELPLDRVTWIAGDIRASRFGLGDRWGELADRIDTIVHCAADVGVTRPYAELRAANVEGTAHVLELAAIGRPKRVHYASTLSVFVGGERDGVLAEDDSLESAVRLYGGYAQSKWAAEWLVRQADSEAAIYRFGLLTGDTRDGRGAERDWLTWFVRGLATLGAHPRLGGESPRVDMTPIDYASRAMAQLVLDGARGTFHLASSRSATLADLVAAIRRAGAELRETTREDFLERIAAHRAELYEPGSRIDPVVALLGACRAGNAYARVRSCDVFQATAMTFDTRRTQAALAGSGITCPPPSEALLDRYVARMLEGT